MRDLSYPYSSFNFLKNFFTLLITFKRQLNFTITKIEYFFETLKKYHEKNALQHDALTSTHTRTTKNEYK